MQTCNGFHQSPIDVSFTGTPVDDTDNADNGALTFGNYETVRAFVIENTVEHYDSRVDVNKLKNKGGHTVVSNIFFCNKAIIKTITQYNRPKKL